MMIALLPSSHAIPCIERLDLSFNNGITSKGFNEVSKCVLNAGVENSLKELNVEMIVTLFAVRKLDGLDILVEY